MWVLLFVFDVFVCGCFFGGLFFERCPSFLLFPREKRSTFLTIITISTRQHLLVSIIRRTREKEREKDLERIHERRKERERDDDDDVHHDDKNDKKQTTIFIADCEESSTKRRRLFRVALTLATTNGGSEKRRPG